ncbi:MAG: DUF4143 domain-containing protein [Bacteroidales bacterium]|nr:DUF4143 domain-containing protein [Bacteroidales bacterium]
MDTSGQFRGSLAEQFVGQETLSAGFNNLFYWPRDAKNSNTEIGYLIQKSNKSIPIEAKSGPTGKLKSLNIFMQNYPEVEKAYVFSEAAYGENTELKINFFPLYFTYVAINRN